MASPRLATVESTSTNELVLILPVKGEKVKGISPGSLEVGVRSREEEPAGPTHWTAITPCLGHDVDTSL